MIVSCTAKVASMADSKKQRSFPECIEESSSKQHGSVVLGTKEKHAGIRTSPKGRGSRKNWWRNGDGKRGEPCDGKKLMFPRVGF